MSIVGQIMSESGVKVLSSRDAQNIVYLLSAERMVLTAEQLSSGKFRSGVKLFRVTGYDSKKRKFPIIAEDQDGKSYKLSPEQASRMTYIAEDGTSVQTTQKRSMVASDTETVRTTSANPYARAKEICDDVVAYHEAGHGFDSSYQYLEEVYGAELRSSFDLPGLVEGTLYRRIRKIGDTYHE